jgi:hypothetical protein
MQSKVTYLILLGIILMSATVSGKHKGEYLRDITRDYRTESLDWGRKSSKGKIKTLFIVSRKGGREVVEAAQRFALDFRAVTTCRASWLAVEDIYEGAIEGTSVYEKTTELLQKLKHKYDLIVLGNFIFEALPPEAQFKILTQVADGAGLVIVYPRRPKLKKVYSEPVKGAEGILALTPLNGLPGKAQKVSPTDLVKTYRFKKGRIATIDYKANHGAHYTGMTLTAPNMYSRTWQAEYENNMVLVGRTLLWAAQKTGEVSVRCKALQDAPVFQQGSNKISLQVTGKKKEAVKIKIRIRDQYNNSVYTAESENKKGSATSVEFDLPVLPAGKFYFDIIALSGQKLCDFGSAVFNIAPPLGKISLKTASVESFKNGSPVKAQLEIEKALEADGKVLITLHDSPYGRIWSRTEMKLPAGSKKLEFSLQDYYIPTLAGFLRCAVYRDKQELQHCEKVLFFPKSGLEVYPVMAWDSVPGEYLSKFYAKQIVENLGWRAGLTHPSAEGKNVRNAAILDQRFVPYMTRIGLHENKKAKGWTEQYSWFFLPKKDQKRAKEIKDQSFYNPEIRELWKRGIEHKLINLPKYGPAIYNLGDENNFSYNIGFTPSDEKEFKVFLKERYKSIENLNREWQSTFKSFADVDHPALKDAKAAKRFSAWLDHRAFMEKQYADIHHFLTSEIKKIDPTAIVGAEGSVPGNLEKTIEKMDFWGPYSNLVMDEVLRSLGPDKVRMLWWGGYVGSHGGRGKYPWPLWKDLLSGTVNGNAWYAGSVAGSESAIGSDMSYAGFFKLLLPHLRALREGQAQLLINTPLKKDKIAVFWSHASESVRLLDSRFVSPLDSMSTFIKFCHASGLNFDFINETRMKRGSLSDYKILFMFGASAVSETEAAAIKSFVKKGGIAIADINPGLLNQYARPMPANSLSQLFGNVVFSNAVEPGRGEVKVAAELLGQKINLHAAKGLRDQRAELFQVKKYGKGSAVLLNFTLGTTQNTVKSGTSLKSFLLSLLSAGGIAPAVSISGIEQDKSMLRIRHGSGFEVIGLMAGKKDIGGSMQIATAAPGFVYESGKGYIGKKDSWKATLDNPYKIFCVFAEKQKAPLLKLSSSSVKCGSAVGIDTALLSKDGVYYLTVSSPDGEIMKLRSQVVIPADTKELKVHFPYSDKPGTYVIALKDIRTNLLTSRKVKVVQ